MYTITLNITMYNSATISFGLNINHKTPTTQGEPSTIDHTLTTATKCTALATHSLTK